MKFIRTYKTLNEDYFDSYLDDDPMKDMLKEHGIDFAIEELKNLFSRESYENTVNDLIHNKLGWSLDRIKNIAGWGKPVAEQMPLDVRYIINVTGEYVYSQMSNDAFKVAHFKDHYDNIEELFHDIEYNISIGKQAWINGLNRDIIQRFRKELTSDRYTGRYRYELSKKAHEAEYRIMKYCDDVVTYFYEDLEDKVKQIKRNIE